jgi:hypothetical protein
VSGKERMRTSEDIMIMKRNSIVEVSQDNEFKG